MRLWFKRKPRNRRLGREAVLDVKLRSSQIRAKRVRMAAIALGIVFAVVLGVYSALNAGAWGLNRLIYRNDAFAIRVLDVQSDGDLDPEQLRRWAGVRTGDNLLALDMVRVQRDLQDVPLIQSASIERIPPHTLRIRVIEREPLARILVPRPRPGRGIEMMEFQLDTEGWVMQPLKPPRQAVPATAAEEYLLPQISGLNADAVMVGRQINLPALQAALQFLLAFEQSGMSGLVDIRRVDLSAGDVLVVTTGQGSEVIIGMGQFDRQLRRWQAIFETGRKLSKAIASVDLAVSNNIPVRWIEASVLPPISPKAIPPKKKKKHV